MSLLEAVCRGGVAAAPVALSQWCAACRVCLRGDGVEPDGDNPYRKVPLGLLGLGGRPSGSGRPTCGAVWTGRRCASPVRNQSGVDIAGGRGRPALVVPMLGLRQNSWT